MKQIKVLSTIYDVYDNDDVYIIHNSFGMHFGDQSKIYIYSKLQPDKKNTILTHELIHAIDEQLQLELSEMQTAALAESLNQIADIKFKWLK